MVGGISVSPVGVTYAGTIGCFLRHHGDNGEEILVLSNNHVLARVDSLPIGTELVQPGPETGQTSPENVFGTLRGTIKLQFSSSPSSPATNRYDAAVGTVTNPRDVQGGMLCGGVAYTPGVIGVPVPGMRVIKSGRRTGITRGDVVATGVGPVQVNYGTAISPRLASFEDTIEIVSVGGGPFSLPGDSGAIILEESTGMPVALLFAGDGTKSTACQLGPICQRFGALPM